jgi:hypothetical protein
MKIFLIQARYFIRSAARESSKASNGTSFLAMLRNFPRWRKSLGISPMEQGLPWMSYRAVDFLETTLRRDWKVFEWGVGGSTCFLVRRVKQLISIEHEDEWAAKVRLSIDGMANASWNLLVIPPRDRTKKELVIPSNPSNYASAAGAYLGKSFEDYASVIDQYDNEEFDVVFVDGRCRPSCAMHALSKIRRGGYLILDDCQRPRYFWIHEEMKRQNWKYNYFNGPGPGIWDFRHTGCWQKPD